MKAGTPVYVIAEGEVFIEEVAYLRQVTGGFKVLRGDAEVRVANIWPTFAEAERELWHRIRKRRHALEQERAELHARVDRFIIRGVPLRKTA